MRASLVRETRQRHHGIGQRIVAPDERLQLVPLARLLGFACPRLLHWLLPLLQHKVSAVRIPLYSAQFAYLFVPLLVQLPLLFVREVHAAVGLAALPRPQILVYRLNMCT